MTSLAFIFGLLPLLFASGAGAAGNRSIGAGAVGGMLFGTFIGVFFIPVLYIVFESLQERISGPPKTREQLDKENEEGGPQGNDPHKPDEPQGQRAEPVVELANAHA
jgi:HAE1 family hydrophobic/amphiphilic exporter-1